LTDSYIKIHGILVAKENLILFEAEPTAENLLLYFKKTIEKELPEAMKLTSLKLYETINSYAEWTA
jgi:6-pyruvoyltetrahydropterin/6-carboxytetrahydropterin synthase